MNITVLDGYTLNPGDNPWAPIEQLGELTVYDRTEPSEVIERARNADIIMTNKTRLTAEILKQLPQCRYIGVLATGYDVVDIAAAAEQGIPVTNIPGYGTEAVAQHVYALLMELSRRTSLHDAMVRDGEWTRNPDWCFWSTPQLDFQGKTLGVIGFGNTGRRVAEIGHAFGMNILAYAPRPKPAPELKRFRFAEREEVLNNADIISLHCPLTDETRHMINETAIAAMRNEAILINTARGPLLDEHAVANALNTGGLGGLGADVVSVEPIEEDNPLLDAPNCLITPHIAWASVTARTTLMQMAADNIAAFASGSPVNVVNAKLLEATSA